MISIDNQACTATFQLVNTLTYYLWRGAGVVERDGFEIRCTRKGTQGSNPCLSAIIPCSALIYINNSYY